MNKKQICQFLTYDYSNYEARELIYNQIIDQFDESLKPDLKINNEPDESRSLDLGEKGICKMPKIDLSICTYLKNQYFPKESRSFEQKRSISPSILINDSI